ncbi:hypothetical protein ACLB2K_061823 [Fragaria x ananassa]
MILGRNSGCADYAAIQCTAGTQHECKLFRSLLLEHRLSGTVSVFNLGIVFHFSLHIPMLFDCIPFVCWRLNVTNMFVFLGESGDTEYEEMIAGTHKTIIMKGVVGKGSEELLRTSGSYVSDDIVPPQSPLVAIVNGQAPTADEIATALKQVSKSAAGM